MENKSIIGKFALESLSIGMYDDPFVIYREYLQNSIDSVDRMMKVKEGRKCRPIIEVSINNDNSVITFYDNGTGIETNKAYSYLLDVGNSNKTNQNDRGFRGIGRLSGLGYCEFLKFETSYYGENIKTIIEYDSKRLKEIFYQPEEVNKSINEILETVVVVDQEVEELKEHYFRVTLKNVSNKVILNKNKVMNYIATNLPVKFSDNFFLIENSIENLDVKHNCRYYDIKLYDQKMTYPIQKKYTRKVKCSDGNKELLPPKIKIIKNDVMNKDIAILWYTHTINYDKILDKDVIGIRYNKSGIQVGSYRNTDGLFLDYKINRCLIGEIIILDDQIYPNARRDAFESNDNFSFLNRQLKYIFEELKNLNTEKCKNKKSEKKQKVAFKLKDTDERSFELIDKMIESLSDIEEFRGIIIDRIKYMNIEEETKKEIIKEINDINYNS